MLVQLTDHKGNEVWINPVHVKMVRQKKPGVVEIYLVVTAGWGSPTMRAAGELHEIIDRLNAAMPADLGAFTPAIEDQPEDDFSGGGAGAGGAAFLG